MRRTTARLQLNEKRVSRVKVSRDFYLDEFINDDIYKRFGASSVWFIDPKIVAVAQLVRDLTHCPVTINNYATGGRYKNSGLRKLSGGIGAKYSQHRYGRAIDVKVSGMTPKEVFQIISDNEDLFMRAGLTVIEKLKFTPTWLHLDVRTTAMDSIWLVNA